MGLPPDALTTTERAARTSFLANREIKLGSESVRGEFLTDLCMEEWRKGNHHDLRVRGGRITGDLVLNYARTNAAVALREVTLGKLRLRRASLGILTLTCSTVQRIEAAGLEAASVELNNGFRAQERVRLVAARIDGDLNFVKGTFGRSEDDRANGWSALILDSARVAGSVRLDEINADGRVSAWRVRVDGAFNAPRATFANDQGGSLNLRNADVGQGADLACTANGVVDLRDARFGGRVSFSEARIKGDLRMSRCQVGGDLRLDQVITESWTPEASENDSSRTASGGSIELRSARLGAVRLDGSAQVAASLDAASMTVDHGLVLGEMTLGGPRLDLSGAKIGDALTVRAVKGREHPIEVRLLGLSVGVLDDAEGSWPEDDRDTHSVDGITITRVERPLLKWRTRWLKSNAIWTPQPWQALGEALRRGGHENEARSLAVERERERTRRAGLGPWSKCARAVFHITIGYGYRPVYALGWALLIVGLGALAFEKSDVTPKAGAPEWSRVLYSLDAFVPVDLTYFSTWIPNDRWMSAVAIAVAASGWLLAALLVGALTGLLKKD